MRGSLIVAGLSVLVLSACGSEEPAQETGTSERGTPSASVTAAGEPAYVESDACRAEAQPALDVVGKALGDPDVQAVEGHLQTLGGMTPEAFAQCTDQVAAPAMESVDALKTAVDASATGTGADLGQELVKAKDRLAAAQQALDATS